ncbi:MAG: anthrone oxygenase family protein [Rhizomicrobium sp.]
MIAQARTIAHAAGMVWLRNVSLVLAFLATTAPMAHVLEMISKLTLDGRSWLSIQQHLYRGWGLVFGPVEILSLLAALGLLAMTRDNRALRNFYLVSSLCYAGMLASFFIFNAPVNAALNTWTANSLPPDWGDFRLRWETGHAITAALSLIGFVAQLRAWKRQ